MKTSYLSHYNLSGKSALVTGAGQGIGAACVHALAEAGALVHCVDRNVDRISGLVDELRAAGYDAAAHTFDVRDTAALNTLADEIAPLDILVCNAGIAHNAPAQELSDEDWQRVIDTNLTGVFKTCRAFGRHMIKAGKGSVINLGSMSGLVVNRPQYQSHYNASKAAVHQFTKSLAVEWAPYGVRVNAVAPGYIRTAIVDMVASQDPAMLGQWLEATPNKRLGEVEEIASVVLFLASNASSLLTGSIISADGGYTAI